MIDFFLYLHVGEIAMLILQQYKQQINQKNQFHTNYQHITYLLVLYVIYPWVCCVCVCIYFYLNYVRHDDSSFNFQFFFRVFLYLFYINKNKKKKPIQIFNFLFLCFYLQKIDADIQYLGIENTKSLIESDIKKNKIIHTRLF